MGQNRGAGGSSAIQNWGKKENGRKWKGREGMGNKEKEWKEEGKEGKRKEKRRGEDRRSCINVHCWELLFKPEFK